jgi:hypothetical protein
MNAGFVSAPSPLGLGFREQAGYNNSADPWTEERYARG